MRIDRTKCVQWVGRVHLEVLCRGNKRAPPNFLQLWQDHLPEKWREDAKLDLLQVADSFRPSSCPLTYSQRHFSQIWWMVLSYSKDRRPQPQIEAAERLPLRRLLRVETSGTRNSKPLGPDIGCLFNSNRGPICRICDSPINTSHMRFILMLIDTIHPRKIR